MPVVTEMLNARDKRAGSTAAISPIDPSDCLAEIDRLVRSPFLSGSESLCKLLQFLAKHTLHSPGEHLKEYEIATQVFGRPMDFDPQADSGVRVQMGRLRTKLAEYYQAAGISDPIRVEVPKGGYSLSFLRQTAAVATDLPEEDGVHTQPSRVGVRFSPLLIGSVLACVLAAVAILIGIFHRRTALAGIASDRATQTVPVGLQTFWSPFVSGGEVPFVIFSNAQFVGDPATGMRYYDPSKDARDQVSQRYAGIGEVMGAKELEGLFLHMGRQFQIKRSTLFTLDDARSNNLIFLGSPTENLTLGEIPYNSGFVFRRLQAGQNGWGQGVVDLHPLKGESSQYLPTSESSPTGVDYAEVALTRGLDRGRWILVLAGATTVGTQGAVDYVCDPDSINDLLRHLNIKPGSDMKPFEALLRVKVVNDVPLTSELVKIRGTE